MGVEGPTELCGFLMSLTHNIECEAVIIQVLGSIQGTLSVDPGLKLALGLQRHKVVAAANVLLVYKKKGESQHDRR
jgi:hypothetical protein